MDLKNFKFNPFFINDYYIFEYDAIPASYRKTFKEKLLKRKGSDDQKNIKLIEFLEDNIRNGDPLGIDYSKFCSEFGISKRMLDCHKTRLLKQLREFYFNWNEEKGENKSERIRRRIKSGMLREARTELIDMEKILTVNHLNIETRINLFEVYENLFYIYFFLRDKRRLNSYLKKISLIFNKLKSEIKNSKILHEIKARYCILESYKLAINRLKLNNIYKAINDLEKTVKFSDMISATTVIQLYYRLGLMYNAAKNKKQSIIAYKNGKQYSEENDLKYDILIFESYIQLRKFSVNNSAAEQYLKFHFQNFDTIVSESKNVSQIMDFEFNYLRFLIYLSRPEADNISIDYINRQILYSRKADAINSWYLELSDQLSNSVYNWINSGNKLSITVDHNVLEMFNDINKRSMLKFNNLYSPNVIVIMYINAIEYEFWKYKEADFFLAEFYIKKLERIIKLYNLNISYSWIESTKIGIRIFEELITDSNKKVFSKNAGSIIDFISRLKSEKQTFNISADYAKLLFIRDILNIPAMDEIVTEFTNWMKLNRADIINEINEILDLS